MYAILTRAGSGALLARRRRLDLRAEATAHPPSPAPPAAADDPGVRA